MAEAPLTAPERTLLKSLIEWCRLAADRAARSKKPDEAVGLLRAAARLEQELTR